MLACGPVFAEPFIAWRNITEIATGAGEKGPWRQNDSRYNYVDDPTVAINRDGDVAVAWVEQGRKGIFFQRLSADGQTQLPEPVNISRSPDTFSWLPRLIRAPDSANRIYILWQEIIFSGGSHGGDILFAHSDDNGATFSHPINLSHSIGGDGKGRINRDVWHNGSLDIMAGKNGALYTAWTEYDGQLWFSSSDNGGKSFTPPRRVTGGGSEKPARAPALALGRDNTLYLAWTTGEDDRAKIRVARSVDGGTSFEEPQLVGTGQGYADAPKLGVGPDGVVHLVFAQSNGGAFGRYTIHYTRSSDGQHFDTSREISRGQLSRIDSTAFPSFDMDGAGRLVVLYELYPNHRKSPRGLGMTVSADGGKTFSPPVMVPHGSDPDGGVNGSQQGLLMKKLAVNRDGEIAIVNSSLKPGERSRVWLIRGVLRVSKGAKDELEVDNPTVAFANKPKPAQYAAIYATCN